MRDISTKSRIDALKKAIPDGQGSLVPPDVEAFAAGGAELSLTLQKRQ
jgi:hypothetical protein